jgi:menaquinol-cytochrome c reductase iron-sulfur subunit
MREIQKLFSRRDFLNYFSLALTAAAGVVVSVPILAYLLTPLLEKPDREWQDIGPASDFVIGQTVEVPIKDPSPLPWAGETATTAAWLRRTEQSQFIAFAVNCTHLGCPVNWIQSGQIFLCPCHGGVFTSNGDVAGGPPAGPLRRHHVRVRNGRVEIKPVPLRVV